MRRLAKAAQRYIDLTECNSMEWGYRLTNIVTALLSPLFDKIGVSPEYEMPLVDGGSFEQPRPLEASISALLVGLFSGRKKVVSSRSVRHILLFVFLFFFC